MLKKTRGGWGLCDIYSCEQMSLEHILHYCMMYVCLFIFCLLWGVFWGVILQYIVFLFFFVSFVVGLFCVLLCWWVFFWGGNITIHCRLVKISTEFCFNNLHRPLLCSMVKAFHHCVMGHWINPSWWTP